MTTEDDFQKKLDKYPDDWQTRLVFADWLQERADPRADGYRAMAAGGIVLCDYYTGEPRSWLPKRTAAVFTRDCSSAKDRCYALPPDWFAKIPGAQGKGDDKPMWVDFPNRRAAEDTAATAFMLLDATRRAELLAATRPPWTGPPAEKPKAKRKAKKPVAKKPAPKKPTTKKPATKKPKAKPTKKAPTKRRTKR